MDFSDPDCFTYPFQLTKGMHRTVYPLLDASNPDLSAKGKTVLVTGAAGGLGKAIAEAWCTAKASKILITSRNAQALEEIASKLRTISPSTEVVVHVGDLDSEQDIQGLFAAAAKLGTVDVLVNSAASLSVSNVTETPASQWWKDFEVNVKGLYLLIQGFLKQGGGKGTVINIGTAGAAVAMPTMSSYNTSKLAQQKVVESVHAEVPDLHIFTMIPGLPMTKMTPPAYHPYAKDDPLLAAGMTLFLSTPRAAWLNGQTISVNWDMEEMEANKQAILDGNLTSLGWLKGQLQKDGHPF